MPQRANRSVNVEASPELCFEVVCDVERYPDWIEEVKEVEVLSRDDDGRPGRVFFRLGGMGRSVSYTLEYYYGSNPLRMAWRLAEGNLIRNMDGEYKFLPMGNDSEATDLHFRLEVDLLTRLPGFVTRRAEHRVVTSAVSGLQSRAEHLASLV